MKKIISLFLALLLLCACGADTEIPADFGRDIESYHEENEFEEKWGVHITLKDVTPEGLTLIFNQSGGTPTGLLETGAYYSLERFENGSWFAVEKEPSDAEFVFDSIAWLIFMEGSTEMPVNWEIPYGKLPAGIYRIGKEVNDFRGPGDYDTAMFYAEFILE